MSVISPTPTSPAWNVSSNGGGGGNFNLGTGRGLSVKQVLDAIAVETGEQLTVKQGDRRPGDPPVLVADASQARRELRFPTYALEPKDDYRHSLAVAPPSSSKKKFPCPEGSGRGQQ